MSLIANAQDVYNYYEIINEGKKKLIQKDFSSALNAYRTAFEKYEYPFARDCYNAIELSAISKDTTNFEYFLQKAVSRGIRIKDIENSGVVDEYLDKVFYTNVKKNEDSLMNLYSSRINWSLREEINQMFSKDQKIREEYYDANIFQRNKIRKKWESLNAKQVKRLIEITDQYGFPGENLIGIDRNEMHPKINTTNYSAGMPIVILIHHFSQPNLSYDEMFLEQVKKGNLYNEHFVTICDFEAKFGKNRFENFGYYGSRHQPKKLDKNTLNLKRQEIGILEFEEIEKLNKIKNFTKFWNRLY